jgi:hypothetical protein
VPETYERGLLLCTAYSQAVDMKPVLPHAEPTCPGTRRRALVGAGGAAAADGAEPTQCVVGGRR